VSRPVEIACGSASRMASVVFTATGNREVGGVVITTGAASSQPLLVPPGQKTKAIVAVSYQTLLL